MSCYSFLEISLDTSSRSVAYGGKVERLSNELTGFMTLILDHPGKAFEKQEIIEAVWPGLSTINDILFAKLKSDAKQVLSKCHAEPEFIQTLPNGHLRFNPAIRVEKAITNSATSPASTTANFAAPFAAPFTAPKAHQSGKILALQSACFGPILVAGVMLTAMAISAVAGL